MSIPRKKKTALKEKPKQKGLYAQSITPFCTNFRLNLEDKLGCPLPGVRVDNVAALKITGAPSKGERVLFAMGILCYLRNARIFFSVHSPASDWPKSERKRRGREERTSRTLPSADVGQHSPFFLSRLALKKMFWSMKAHFNGM